MNSFIAELKRRNVFSVTAGYAVIAWLLMQLAVVLESALHLPNWFDTLITVLVLIGFPVAVLLSWIFRFTSKGIERTLRNPDIDKASHSTNTIIIFSLTGLIMLGLIWLMWQHLGKSDFIDFADNAPNETSTELSNTQTNKPFEGLISEATQSIAVLPFEDFSANKDQSYFGRGISEELLNLLSRVKGLRVVSRTSSFAFAGTDSSAGDIAKALHVMHIIEGSVRKSGDTIRITAQLINAQTDEHVWSQTYDALLSAQNLFTVQDEIANAIVSQLKGELTVVPLEASDKTLSLQAYELYLHARENQKLRTPESLAIAANDFTQVIDLDPNFAYAYSGLSETYLLMSAYAGLDKNTSLEKATSLVARALELAPNSAEVLTSAAYLASSENTVSSIILAEDYALQAISANQNYANAYFILAGVLWDQGRLNEAIANYKQARNLDPLSTIVLGNLARIYLSVGDQVAARSIGEDLIRLHPQLPLGYIVLADVARNAGEYANAHSLLQDAYALNQDSTTIKNSLRRVYNLMGLHEQALWYENSPTSQVWYAIYTHDAQLAQSALPKVKKMTDAGWLLYYLRNYTKTKQIVEGYISAYHLLDKPIADPSTADFIIAYAQIQKALGEDNTHAIEMLSKYFAFKQPEALFDSKELTQRALFSALSEQYEQTYQWLDRILALGYILSFTDPIFDNIKQTQKFKTRQAQMQQLQDKNKLEVKTQLAAPKPQWIIPSAALKEDI